MSRLATLAALLPLLAGASEDPRTQVVLESECRTVASQRQLTLFANGTLRLRDGEGATRTMRLVELGNSETEAYVARLSEIAFDDLAPQSRGLQGDLVESCRVEIDLPRDEPRVFTYDAFDSLTLGLRHVLLVIDDLIAEFQTVSDVEARARGYDPEIGDILVRRSDGARFEVLGFTMEGTGVELEGIDQPITVFVREDQILDEYDPQGEAGEGR